MYEQVFNFNSRPFTSTPYVKHYFPAAAMNQAFGQASICVDRASGPVVAIGDIGTGKSLLLAKLESEYQNRLQVVNLVCSSVNCRREFLQNILFQIGKPFNMDSETELRFAVIESAQPTAASPDGLLLLIDDAEMLTADVFDELRVLSNVVVDGTPQVRLVLAGRKSLEERLADPAHASFSQRIASRVFLSNLSRDETAAYVVEHINRVGGNGQTMFPSETAAKLHELTDGCPRLINQVCDFGLILAGTRGATTISPNLIEEAWNDVQSLPMGSGSVQTESASQQAATGEENDWTLIEFGQLEEDSPQPADATVYDFENSGAVEESNEGYSPQPEEPTTEAQQQPVETPETPTGNIDSELGMDIESLQAMQDAAATNQKPHSQEVESTQETPTDDVATEPQDQGSPEDAARIAMEQQLAAVFGTSLPSSAPTEIETNDTGSATITPSVEASSESPSADLDPADLVEPASTDTPQEFETPGVSNSIVGTAAGATFAAGAVAAAFNSFSSETPESPTDEESFKPATSALNEQNQDVDQPVASVPRSVEPDSSSPSDDASETPHPFTPSSPAQEPGGFVPATQPMETADEVAAESEAETTNAQPEPESKVAEASPANDDPFDESFAVEASVPIRPTSEIIEQNQNALKISSSDLEHVQPVHDPTPDEVIHPSLEQTAESNSAKTKAPVDDSWSAAKAEEPTTSLPEESSLSAQEEDDRVTNEPQVAESTRGFSIMPMDEPADPTPEKEQPVEAAAANLALSVDAESEPASAEVETTQAPANPNTDHKHKDDIISEEISRQADAILARLSKVTKPVVAEQEEQILADIKSQQREVTDSQLLGETEEPQPSLQIPAPILHQDDSELLVVSPETNTAEAVDEPETISMTDSPISSGRASRMDYEKLFDRLRNLPENDQQ